MDRRRASAYARVGVAYPVVTVVAAAGLARLLGWSVGVAVLALSAFAAAAVVAVVASDTGGMRPPEADRGREHHRGFLGVGGAGGFLAGAAGGPATGAAAGRRARLRVYAVGLFVLTATLVLVLGGAVPGL
ncbi:hypothetical protein [Halobaculum lipolyticum]|uniref:Membrane transporter protein n=1 Tax=Halobaculum lipolyticum TaxID=3032001 RepID=A0ABD5WA25_9EURY|nr:hypothetical protein [Halobaculum sp. DT31]